MVDSGKDDLPNLFCLEALICSSWIKVSQQVTSWNLTKFVAGWLTCISELVIRLCATQYSGFSVRITSRRLRNILQRCPIN